MPAAMQAKGLAPDEPASRTVDVEAFSRNLARAIEQGGKALAAYMKPREEGKVEDSFAADIADIVKTVAKVLEYWLSDPERVLQLQQNIGRSYLDLWASAMHRLSGDEFKPVVAADPKDKRFADPEWSQNQFYDFLRQLYLLTVHWSEKLVSDAEGIDEHTRRKAEFYVRQFANAVSPSNFVLTNPELIRETLTTNAENLANGFQMLSEDIVAGRGNLKIRQTDPSNFEVGRNLALTAVDAIDFGAITVGGTTTLTSSGGAVGVDALNAAGPITASGDSIDIRGGAMQFASLTANVGNALIRSTGNLSIASGSVAGSASAWRARAAASARRPSR